MVSSFQRVYKSRRSAIVTIPSTNARLRIFFARLVSAVLTLGMG